MSSIPEVVQLAFEVDEENVSVINREGDRIPLFPSDRLSPFDLSESLRQAIITLMQDQ